MLVGPELELVELITLSNLTRVELELPLRLEIFVYVFVGPHCLDTNINLKVENKIIKAVLKIGLCDIMSNHIGMSKNCQPCFLFRFSYKNGL